MDSASSGVVTLLTYLFLMLVLAAAGVLMWNEFTDSGSATVKEALTGAEGERKRLADAQARRQSESQKAWDDEAADNDAINGVLRDIVDEQARDYQVMRDVVDAAGVSRSVLSKMEQAPRPDVKPPSAGPAVVSVSSTD